MHSCEQWWIELKTILDAKHEERCFNFWQLAILNHLWIYVLANSYIFHNVENIVKHSLVISKWRMDI
jgi:hypothetical protein